MGLNVLGVRRSGDPHPLCDKVVTPDRMDEVLPQADFVLVTLPYTPETVGLVNRDAFALMKEGAGFVTTAPTQTYDYETLAEHLRSGRLSGAVLDGFDPEPVPPESPIWEMPNLVMTPHTSCIDRDQYSPLSLDVLFDNLRADLAGKPLPTRANVERGY